ncbi:PTS sugar transporter subunit IIB [Erysipelotrichaceae bacterium MTC7]|nr:PTS sugar transporter subunit IIB [Erysipelotrichaceae bacterium MTC7]
MKILLVCAGGISTSLLMKKMKKYWEEQSIELEIDAVGISDYSEVYSNYDIILVGPQIGYRLEEIKETTNIPCAVIESFDYAVANCPNIMELVNKLYEKK